MLYDEAKKAFMKTIWLKEGMRFKFLVNGSYKLSEEYSQVTVIINIKVERRRIR